MNKKINFVFLNLLIIMISSMVSCGKDDGVGGGGGGDDDSYTMTEITSLEYGDTQAISLMKGATKLSNTVWHADNATLAFQLANLLDANKEDNAITFSKVGTVELAASNLSPADYTALSSKPRANFQDFQAFTTFLTEKALGGTFNSYTVKPRDISTKTIVVLNEAGSVTIDSRDVSIGDVDDITGLTYSISASNLVGSVSPGKLLVAGYTIDGVKIGSVLTGVLSGSPISSMGAVVADPDKDVIKITFTKANLAKDQKYTVTFNSFGADGGKFKASQDKAVTFTVIP